MSGAGGNPDNNDPNLDFNSADFDEIFNVIQRVDPVGAEGAIGVQGAQEVQPQEIVPQQQVYSNQPVEFINGQFPANNQYIVTQRRIMPPQPQTQSNHPNAYVRILEQPASKALRFRYECEGRSAGSIPGANSTPENKTFPTIQVVGAKGRAVVVVSCVTKDEPFRPHPHNLVGKEGCKKGVCTLEINNEEMTVSFSNLGIQCVKKKDIEDALKVREEIRVDPFRTGFAHKTNPSGIDLNVVRLCFQVFLEGDRGKFTRPLKAIVSEPIFDKKAMSDLTICKLSDCTSPANGGREIILLCEKVAKEDIAIRFYEERNGGRNLWQAQGEFQHSQVHKQVAIAFKTPPYENERIDENVRVKIQLLRPSDGAVSESLPFVYTPIETDTGAELRRKRQRISQSGEMFAPIVSQISPVDRQNAAYQTVSPGLRPIKHEPRDQTPSPFAAAPLFGGTMTVNQFDYRNPQATPTPSPQPPQMHPFSVSPQPNQMGGGMFQPFGGPTTSPQFSAQQPFTALHHQHQQQQQQQQHHGSTLHPGNFADGNFPLNFMPPLPNNNNILTPVPAAMESAASMNLPANLAWQRPTIYN